MCFFPLFLAPVRNRLRWYYSNDRDRWGKVFWAGKKLVVYILCCWFYLLNARLSYILAYKRIYNYSYTSVVTIKVLCLLSLHCLFGHSRVIKENDSSFSFQAQLFEGPLSSVFSVTVQLNWKARRSSVWIQNATIDLTLSSYIYIHILA